MECAQEKLSRKRIDWTNSSWIKHYWLYHECNDYGRVTNYKGVKSCGFVCVEDQVHVL